MLLHACSMSHVLLHNQSTFPLKWRMYQSSFLSKKKKNVFKFKWHNVLSKERFSFGEVIRLYFFQIPFYGNHQH